MISNIKEFCKMFYNSTFLPITYYDLKLNEYISFPDEANFQLSIKAPSSKFFNFQKNPDYFVSDSFGFYGFIEFDHNNFFLILGPIFSTPISDETIHIFMKEWAINSDSRLETAQFLQSIPQLSYIQFLNTLAYLHYCINDEVINPTKHFELRKANKSTNIFSIHTEKLVESKENQRNHNTYYYEKELMQYVQNGDVNNLKTLLSSSFSLSEGVVADNSLRQAKNIFISITTLTTRAAILGGMSIEEAYQLSDLYIQECEHTQEFSHVNNLTYAMLIAFTERVSRNMIPKDMSTEVFECVQFISRHTNEPIQVGDVADHIKRSRSYLTKKFKQELGSDVSTFIMRCKLEEAKSLLTFTDKSLSEISNYLCFSTQAYFQNVFKKKYGITPNQFRKNINRIN